MLHDGNSVSSYTDEEKSRDIDDEENALRFPLTILDTNNDIFVGQYNSKRKTQQAINRYQIMRENRKLKKLSVIHHAADCLSDFTYRLRNTG
jgi:hypothetical protein